MNVVVVILRSLLPDGIERRLGYDRVQYISDLFKSSYYQVIVEDITPYNRNSAAERLVAENNQILRAMENVSQNYRRNPVLLVRDTSITSRTASGIDTIIKGLLSQDKPFHIFYLAKWLDTCGQYSDFTTLNNGVSVKRTYGPRGLQCVLLTKEGRELLHSMINPSTHIKSKDISDEIHDLVYNGDLTAVCTTPNIFDFNIDTATRSTDYEKLNQCKPVNVGNLDNNTRSVLRYWWLAVALVLVILVALAVAKVYYV